MTKVLAFVKRNPVVTVAAVLRGGWLVVVLGLVFALLLGGKELLSAAKAPEQPTEEFQQVMEKYEQEKLKLENALSLEQRELNNLQTYMQNSKRMQLDPNNKRVSTLVLGISVEAEIGTAYDAVLSQIQEQYAGLMKGFDLTQFTKGTEYENVPDKYLREVIELDSKDVGVLTLTVMGNDGTDCQKVASNIYAALLEKKFAVEAASYGHQLSQLTDAVTRTEVDLELEKEQTEKLDKLEQLRLSVLKLQEDLQALAEPSAATSNETVKNTVIGGLIGVILAVVWLVLRQMFAGKITGTRQMVEDFQLPCIGNTVRSKGVWPRLAQLVVGERTWKNTQDALSYIQGSADAYLPAQGSVALVSTLPQMDKAVAEGIEKALSREGRQVVVVQDLFHNPKGLNAICASEGVVLLEKTYQSKMVAISEAVDQVQELGKPIYGFIVM